MSETISLYDLVGMKRKNSVLKSVFINKNKSNTYSQCYIEVEAYDETFEKNTLYPSQQDKVCDTIEKAIIKYQEKIKEFIGDYSDRIDVMHYSTFDRHFQQLIILDEGKELDIKNFY